MLSPHLMKRGQQPGGPGFFTPCVEVRRLVERLCCRFRPFSDRHLQHTQPNSSCYRTQGILHCVVLDSYRRRTVSLRHNMNHNTDEHTKPWEMDQELRGSKRGPLEDCLTVGRLHEQQQQSLMSSRAWMPL
jgi:hypothetical protein